MQCSVCGSPLPVGANACPRCGSLVSKEATGNDETIRSSHSSVQAPPSPYGSPSAGPIHTAYGNADVAPPPPPASYPSYTPYMPPGQTTPAGYQQYAPNYNTPYPQSTPQPARRGAGRIILIALI